jgi:hypothetical protein
MSDNSPNPFDWIIADARFLPQDAGIGYAVNFSLGEHGTRTEAAM